jgi:Holliday junction DNA helicase RuvB
MKQTLYLPWYDEADLAEILRRRVRGVGWQVQDEVLPLLASLAKGTPRQALRLLSASHRVSRSQDETTVTLAHAKRAVTLEGLDEMGLSAVEQAYLRVVAEGDSKLNVISSRIGMPTRSVQTIIEPYLLRSGLIVKTDSRRQLTEKGREHLSESRADGA